MLENLPGNPVFRRFSLRDVNPLGGTVKTRNICKPNKAMRILHKRLIGEIRSLHVDMSSATACRPGDSPLKNIRRHKGHRYFYATDLHSAYPNVDIRKLANALIETNPSLSGKMEFLLGFLSRFCSVSEGGLAIGLPASPDLFNFYAAVFIDGPMRGLCERYGITYTRYLDDLTFSSNLPIGAKKRRALREVVCVAGFEIQHRKSQVCDLEKGPIVLNGIGLDKNGRVFIPRRYTRFIDGCLHNASKSGSPVTLARIAGLMGVFFSLGKKFFNFNQTERKTLIRYKRFRKTLHDKK